MGRSLGQTLGGIGGAILGGILGSVIPGIGTVAGATIGFTLGATVGTFVDPPQVGEPDASAFAQQDLQFNTFAKNLPVPVVYGINRVAGNIVWIGNTFSEVIEKEVEGGGGKGGGGGGKGGGVTQQEVRYHADFACALSEGEISGVLRTWIDETDISENEGLNFTIYVGNDTQTAAPEVITGLGSDAPAFRHLAYTLFTGDLGNINRIPIVNQLVVGLFPEPPSEATVVLEDTGNYRITDLEQCDADTFLGGSVYAGIVYRTSSGVSEVWSRSVNYGSFGAPPQQPIAIHSGVPGRAYVAASGIGTPGSIQRTEDCFATVDCLATLDGNAGYVHEIVAIQNNSSEVLAFCGRVFLPTPTGPYSGGCYRSTDGGCTFSFQDGMVSGTFESNHFPSAFQFPGTDIVVAHGGSGPSVWRSTDRGQSWSQILNGVSDGIGPPGVGGVALDGSTGIFCEFGPILLLTNDAGVSWSKITSPFNVHPTTALTGAAINQGNFYVLQRALPTTNIVWVSSDAGTTWTQVWSSAPFGRDLLVTNTDICVGGGQPAAISCFGFDIDLTCGNPANIIKDFLTNTRYGFGISETNLDIGSFDTAGAYCDELVTLPDGTTEKRFCLDIVLDRGEPTLDHLRKMLATFRGFLAWSQGTVKLKIEREELVAQSFDMSNIVAGSFTWRKQSYRDRPNVVKVEFIEPGANDDYRLDFAQAFDDWDIDKSGERREAVYRLLGIKRRSQAQRMAQFLLDKAIHVVHAASFRVGIGALQSEVGDVVEVTHDVPAWVTKPMRIIKIDEAENDEFVLTLLEYNAAVYASADQTSVSDSGDLTRPQDLFSVPYHGARLSAHQDPISDDIYVTLTRVATNDLLSSFRFFGKRDDEAYVSLGEAIPLVPTAFIDSDVRTVAVAQTGEGPPTGGNSLYTDVVTADAPISWWRMGTETVAPSTLTDAVGVGHMVKQSAGSVTAQQSPLVISQTTSPVDIYSFKMHDPSSGAFFNRELGFAGMGSYQHSPCTIEGWVMSDSYSELAATPSQIAIWKDGSWRIYRDASTGRWRGEISTVSGTIEALSTMTTSPSVPYYFALVYDEVDVRLYAGDALTAVFSLTVTASASAPIDPGTSGRLQIAADDTGAGSTSKLKGWFDEWAFYDTALTSSQLYTHFHVGIGSGVPVEGAPTSGGSGSVAVLGLPDGWSTQLFQANSTSLATGISTFGTAIMSPGIVNPTSGFLLIYTDGTSFSTLPEAGRYPATGFVTLTDGDVYTYDRVLNYITATQTFIPIFSPKGGFANVGSAWIRNEQIGYATFTDSLIQGATRGAGGTTATSHSNILSLEAVAVASNGGVLNYTAAFTDVLSNVPFFEIQSQYIYLGAASRFPMIEFFLAQNAPTPITMAFEYSTADGTWESYSQTSGFIPVFDATSGLTQSGRMYLEPPGNWETTRSTLPGSNDLTDGTSRFYLRIINTNTAATPPYELQTFVDGELIFAGRSPSTAFIYSPQAVDSGQLLTIKAIAVGGLGPQVQDGTVSPTFTIQEGA